MTCEHISKDAYCNKFNMTCIFWIRLMPLSNCPDYEHELTSRPEVD